MLPNKYLLISINFISLLLSYSVCLHSKYFLKRTCLNQRVIGRRIHSTQLDGEVYINETEEELRKVIKALKNEKEKKKFELMATEVAIQQAQNELTNIITNKYEINTNKSRLGNDYGFISRSSGSVANFGNVTVPPSALYLAGDNFKRELNYLIQSFNVDANSNGLTDESKLKLSKLVLSNDAVWQREKLRPEIKAPWIIKGPYYILCFLLDALFDGQPISRFYFLETVARMPYFSYITMLHTYETLGWWRRSTQAKRVHFAEEYNEFHHLLIWESLGGGMYAHVNTTVFYT